MSGSLLKLLNGKFQIHFKGYTGSDGEVKIALGPSAPDGGIEPGHDHTQHRPPGDVRARAGQRDSDIFVRLNSQFRYSGSDECFVASIEIRKGLYFCLPQFG